MLVRDVLQKTTAFFRDKGFPSPRLDTELLMADALEWDRVKIYLNYEYPLNESELEKCRARVRRRAHGEPVAYILGRRDFFNHTFHVEPGVLIPRPETETLVERTLSWLKTQTFSEGAPARLVDLGCGSGCIGLSVLAAVPDARLLAVDVSETAIRVTAKNAEALGLTERIALLRQAAEELALDAVESALGGPVDAVLANPPYIAPDDPEVEPNVRRFEPAEALFSGTDGLEHIRVWSRIASRVVRPGGFVMFEIGAGQGDEVRGIFESVGTFKDVKVIADLAGHERFVQCIRSGES